MIVRISGLTKTYTRGAQPALDSVDLTIPHGTFGLLGPNGAGKTTSFRMMIGMITPENGRVLFDGEDVTYLPMYQHARRGMGYLAQEPSIFGKLTVEDNLKLVLEMRKDLTAKESPPISSEGLVLQTISKFGITGRLLGSTER